MPKTGKRKELSVEIKNVIIDEYKKGKSLRCIGELFKLQHSTVQFIVDKYKRNGSVENAPRSGRPKKVSRRDVSLVLKEVKKIPEQLGRT